MCGIAGILSTNLNHKQQFCSRAIELLRHRGPDAQGRWMGPSVGLAHTRLAILDLSAAGDQPMHFEEGRYVMVYNGEIYNHLELRKQFFPERRWRGHSDTETLLALFQRFGTDMFAKLVGMWALAIWDIQEKELVLSRGRYGQKPLYYRFYENGTFAIASEIKPLLVLGESNPANLLMVADYLALGNYDHFGSQTFFSEIHQLLPATFAKIKLEQQGLCPKKYWLLPVVPNRERIPVGQTEIEALQNLLRQAVISQRLSDVPIGTTLSGGIDSSLVTGMLAASTTEEEPIMTFTAQTPGSKWDESHYVKAVKDKWGDRIRLYVKDLNRTQISESLSKTLFIQEEPFGDPSIIAHGFLMDMAKEAGVKVVLGGQGADEVFFGYPHSIHHLLSHELSNLNLRYSLSELSRENFQRRERAWIVLGAFFPKMERYLRRKSRERRKFFLPESLRLESDSGSYLELANQWKGILKESIRGVHIPHLVHYDDRNGMARSIEGRMPFLDHRLLDLVAQFEGKSHFQQGFSKFLIREAGKAYLPDKVLARRDKIGFYTPLGDMLFENIKFVERTILASDWNMGPLVSEDIELSKQRVSSHHRLQRLWRLTSLVVWAELFNVKMDWGFN